MSTLCRANTGIWGSKPSHAGIQEPHPPPHWGPPPLDAAALHRGAVLRAPLVFLASAEMSRMDICLASRLDLAQSPAAGRGWGEMGGGEIGGVHITLTSPIPARRLLSNRGCEKRKVRCVQFGIFSPDDIINFSVCQIKNHEKFGQDGVVSTRPTTCPPTRSPSIHPRPRCTSDTCVILISAQPKEAGLMDPKLGVPPRANYK